MRNQVFLISLLLLISCIVLNGCGPVSKVGSFLSYRLEEGLTSKKKKEEEDLITLLREADRAFRRGNYEIAYEYYSKIKNMYPGSPQAVLAELRMADSKFWSQDYLEAIPLYESFEKFYPNNEAIPYVIFQIGTCYYKLKQSYDKDQTYTKKAIETYQRLLQNFPQNPYRLETEKRIKELRELLAKHELYVAKFYYKMGYYRGAYNRILYILNNFSDTQTSKEAQKLAFSYYQKALIETKELAEGNKKDFWGEKFP